MLAQYESSRFELDEVGTEALLLGLLAEEQGIAARAMEASGLKYEKLLKAVAGLLGKKAPDTKAKTKAEDGSKKELEIDFSAQAQVALEDACELAQAADAYEAAGTRTNILMKGGGVDTEHLLLALIQSEHCPAAKALAKLDVDKVKLKSMVLNLAAEEL